MRSFQASAPTRADRITIDGYGVFASSGSGMLALIIVSLCFAGCSGKRPPQADEQVPTVICSDAVTQQITDFDEFVGRTEAAATVNVQARVSGFLQSIEFEDGQFVEKDQLLAKIEPDEYEAIQKQSEAQIELAGARLELAKSELARAKKLVANNATSQEEFDAKASAVKQAAAEVVVASADAARTSLDVKYTEVRAPISGRIDRAFITPGNMVSGGLGPGTLLTRIVDLTPIYAYFDVDEASILRYIRKEKSKDSPGQDADDPVQQSTLRDMQLPCYLQLLDEDDFPHVGMLDFLENQVDKMTGTIRLRGIFQNEDRLLQSGMYVRLRIPTSEPYMAVLIPEIAIGTDQSYKYAFVINDQNEAVRRTVELGESRGPLRVITSGIDPGDTVVVRGIQRIRPGMKVHVERQPISPVDSSAAETPATETPSAETQATATPETDRPDGEEGAQP
ncbi:MAG: efflux RND transporter periplasmic adaptor subunit [Planctomycetales bacterium]|nr:efflux RND transporter periplasmic adaptor subunit [Planctomycetales bacterium]